MKKIINIISALILGLATSVLAANVDPARFTQGTNPVVSAPTFTITGTPGNISATYYIVCHDSLGNVSSPSAATIINTIPNTLNSTNFVRLNWSNACISVDILKNSIYTALAIGATVGSTADVGQGLVAYNPVLPPLTGAVNLIGPAIIQGSVAFPPVSKTILVADYIDFTAGALQVGILTTNSNITLSNPSNGQHLILDILQDSSGNHTLAFTTVPNYTISWLGGTVPTITSTANTYSTFSFYVVGTTIIGSMSGAGGSGSFSISNGGAVSHQYVTGSSSNGALTRAQPSAADITGLYTPNLCTTVTGTTTSTLTPANTTYPITECHNLVLSGNNTTTTFAVGGAPVNGWVDHLIVTQPTGSNNYTFTLTAGSGVAVIYPASGGCPALPTMPTGTGHALELSLLYNNNPTTPEIDVLSCVVTGA